MMKLAEVGVIVLLSFVVLLISGCSQQQQSSGDENPELRSKEVQINEENPEAQQKLEFARNNLKMAKKGILSYSQLVAICRSLIEDYPGSQYDRQARTLLRQIPEDLRPQFNITDEELEL